MATAPKIARALLLMTALTGLSVSALSVSNAQDKGTPKKSKKDSGHVEIREGKDGKFRFMIYSGDKFLGMSAANGFETAKDAEKAFEEFKEVVGGVYKPVVGKKHETDDELKAKSKAKSKRETDDEPKAKSKREDK